MKKILCFILAFSLIIVQVFSIPVISVEADESFEAALGLFDRVGSDNEYYYNNLLQNGYQKALYNGLVNAYKLHGEEYVKPKICLKFNFKNTNIDTQEMLDSFSNELNFNRVWNAFVYDNPQLFWLSESRINLNSDGRDCYVEVEITSIGEYKESPNKLLQDYREFNSKVKEIVDVAAGSSDYDKLVRFNTYLIDNNEYNTSIDLTTAILRLPNCAVSAVLSKYSPVCQGYATAFKIFCDLSGIDCILVLGSGISLQDMRVEAHAWNYVKLGGDWYAVDATWNDTPVVERRQNYFLVGSETIVEPLWENVGKFRDTHIVSPMFDNDDFYPELSRLKYTSVGDINQDGIVNSVDVIYLASFLANWKDYRALDQKLLDVNKDGFVDPLDLIVLSRFVAGWQGYSVLPHIS